MQSSRSGAVVIQGTTQITTRVVNSQIRPWGWRLLSAAVLGGGGLWMASRAKDPRLQAVASGLFFGAVDTIKSL